jgi:hypothetical protein
VLKKVDNVMVIVSSIFLVFTPMIKPVITVVVGVLLLAVGIFRFARSGSK